MKTRATTWCLGAFTTITAALGLPACSTDTAAPITVPEMRSQAVRQTNPDVAPADRKALSDGNAAFAMALYQQVEAGNPNLVFSPASISTALAMTWAGARSGTETAMATALRFTLPQERLHPAMNELTATLAARGEGKRGADDGPFRLRIVNTMWAQEKFVLLPGFLDVLARNYGAGVNVLDFAGATEASRQTINRWVSDQTEGRIKDLLAEGVLDPSTKLVLTNAVYFNAAWKTRFAPEDTGDGPFDRADASTINVPTMHLAARFRAGVVTGLATAVALPYQDERLSMLVVLPDPGKLGALEAQLAIRGTADIDAALTEQSVILTMPRFKFETPIDLKKALSALGMSLAFEDGADFSGINSGSDLRIKAVLHKAFIAVAEKGTEAAAATAVVAVDTAAPLGLNVAVNRPFLFFVRDDATGAVLFMGRVSDPSASIK
jgi:serpin B